MKSYQEIGPGTLMMAIQSMEQVMDELGADTQSKDQTELPDIEELYLTYWKALMELKKAYMLAIDKCDNMPALETFSHIDNSNFKNFE